MSECKLHEIWVSTDEFHDVADGIRTVEWSRGSELIPLGSYVALRERREPSGESTGRCVVRALAAVLEASDPKQDHVELCFRCTGAFPVVALHPHVD